MDARQSAHQVPTTDAEIEDMILRHEGSAYTDHPADRGGPTRYGITIPVLAKFRGRAVTADDIRALERSEAAAVYNLLFIKPFTGMEHAVLRANVIDMGVNAGVRRGVMLLQQTIGAGVDGVFGPETIRLSKARDWNPLFVGTRLAFYERIIENNHSQIVWRNGWRNRALSFYGVAHRLPLRSDGKPSFGFTGKAYF